jgi:hypothetical protein
MIRENDHYGGLIVAVGSSACERGRIVPVPNAVVQRQFMKTARQKPIQGFPSILRRPAYKGTKLHVPG